MNRQTTLHDELRALQDGDSIIIHTDERTVRGVVEDTFYEPDTGYADGHVDIDLCAAWDDVQDVCTSQSVTLGQSTNYRGRWKEPTLHGWYEVLEDGFVVNDDTNVNLGTVESIDHE